MSRPLQIVIAGQIPPPVGGQNLNIARILQLLGEEKDFHVRHWAFRFTPQWTQGRQRSWRKIVELVFVWFRLIKIRLGGPIDLILYPSGGPHLAPVVRDILLLPWAAFWAKKVVLHFHAAGVAEALPTMSKRVRRLLLWAHNKCYGAISLTEFGKRDPAALGMTKIDAMPLAIEDEPVPPRQPPAQPPLLLHLGHLCPDKGTPQLLEAARAALEAGAPPFRLQLVGEPLPPYSYAQIDEDIQRLELEDVVEVAGLKRGKELDTAYAEADLFIFSSVAPYESFGMVLIEAMRFSLPLITTNWRANTEVAGHNFGGVVAAVETDLTTGLTTALREALDQQADWPAWGQRNRQTFEQRYTLPVLQQNLANYLRHHA